MMCKKCSKEIPENSKFCNLCGAPTFEQTKAKKKRGNGQGTVLKMPNGKYRAVVTLGYYIDDEGKKHRKNRTKVFDKKKDAILALKELKNEKAKPKEHNITFYNLYLDFLKLHENKVTKSTINCYKSAVKQFEKIYFIKFLDLVTKDFQNCVDNCELGIRTKENMKALCSLLYNYAGQIGLNFEKNYAEFIFIDRKEQPVSERDSFTKDELKIIKENLNVGIARYIYIMCYTGYRINEFLSRKKEDCRFTKIDGRDIMYIIGGNKTEAGKNKIVTISPKIEKIVTEMYKSCNNNSDYIFGLNGSHYPIKKFRKDFKETLEQLKIRTELVPHCCRHTFATLMKNVNAPNVDKMALIGHSNIETTEHYQHAHIEDLYKITLVI